jgi:hypothetical protein
MQLKHFKSLRKLINSQKSLTHDVSVRHESKTFGFANFVVCAGFWGYFEWIHSPCSCETECKLAMSRSFDS